MKKILFYAPLFLLTLAACKKKEKEPTKAELLQNGKWKLTAANFNNIFDLMDQFKDCQKDNTYIFNSNKTITADEGASKCKDTAAQSRTDGNWTLLNNDAQLSISGSSITSTFGSSSMTGDIVTLNSSTLQIKKDTIVSGIRGTANISFTNVK